jgi:hypothetical protein
MSSVLERRYRRLLRLLPANYRYHWEEEMVGAFMEGAHAGDLASGRALRGERLSVVGLAARLRLTGEHGTPRGLVWYQALHGLALLILLYQALSATMSVAIRIRSVIDYFPLEGWSAYLGFLAWSPALGLFWVAAFGCFVLARLRAARVLVVLGALGGIAMAVVPYVIYRSQGYVPPFGPGDVSRYGWLAVSVGTVLLCSRAMPASRPLWLCAYGIGSLVLVPMMLNVFAPLGIGHQYADLTDNVSMVSIVAMVGALTLAAMGWRPSTRWLLALAVFGGGIAAVRLLTVGPVELPPFWTGPRYHDLAALARNLDVVAVGLAIVCAVVALLLLRRLSGSPSAPSAISDART